MNEAEYIFKTDIKDKKQGLSGARGQKKGSKSKKCTLPSDYLTASQKRKLNGEVKTYKMKEPITWETFKNMPKDYQQSYIAGMCDTYHVTAVQLADMMYVSSATLLKYIKDHGLVDTHLPGRGHRMSAAQFDAWNKFLNEHRGVGKNVTKSRRDESYYQQAEEQIIREVSTEPAEVKHPATPRHVSFGYEGDINLKDVYAYILFLAGEEKFKGKIDININFDAR